MPGQRNPSASLDPTVRRRKDPSRKPLSTNITDSVSGTRLAISDPLIGIDSGLRRSKRASRQIAGMPPPDQRQKRTFSSLAMGSWALSFSSSERAASVIPMRSLRGSPLDTARDSAIPASLPKTGASLRAVP